MKNSFMSTSSSAMSSGSRSACLKKLTFFLMSFSQSRRNSSLIQSVWIALFANKVEDFVGGEGECMHGNRVSICEPQCYCRPELTASRVQLAYLQHCTGIAHDQAF